MDLIEYQGEALPTQRRERMGSEPTPTEYLDEHLEIKHTYDRQAQLSLLEHLSPPSLS